jgi:sterol desaturase/sphingolipid hydroxylase (fatty acid hydroxylase superfamily)
MHTASPAKPDLSISDPDPAGPMQAGPVANFLHTLWHGNLQFERSGPQLIALILLSLAGFLIWLIPQDALSDFDSLRNSESVRIFYMVKNLMLAEVDSSMAALLLMIAIGRAFFVILVGTLDVVLYKKVTGRAFDWESMMNISVVNAVLIFSGIFVFFNPSFKQALTHYDALLQSVPTLFDLNGTLALVIAMLIGDFCFYWSHRICHGVRFFWNLGHIYHHRNRNLTQLTCAIEPPAMILQAAGGLSLLLLPLLSKLFTTDIHAAGWALVAFMVIDTWIDPSHSPVMYYLESRSKVLKSLRWAFVTVGVHFTHHAREVEGKYGTGCNFGARLTIWDRLFGTYSEPSDAIPQTGLFDPKADFCINPLRYLAHPFVRMGKELRQNKLRHWPAILLGPTSYEPPKPVHTSY